MTLDRHQTTPLVSQLKGEEAYLLPVVIEFIDRLPARLTALDSAWERHDLARIELLAHRLQVAELMGYPELAGLARHLEKAARSRSSEAVNLLRADVNRAVHSIIIGREQVALRVSQLVA